MKKIIYLVCLLIFFGLQQGYSRTKFFWKDFTVTVTGSLFGYDGSDRKTFPLVGARVELMDSDADGSTLFDDLLGTAYVQPDGSFTVTGTGGDGGNFSWSKPDVYIRVVFNNDKGVRLTDELDINRYEDTPEHDHDNVEGNLDIGSWVFGTGVNNGDGTKPGVWIKACEDWNDYFAIMGTDPPSGKYDLEYWSAIWAGTPWTNTNTTHWPIHYSTWASKHEFGHVIRHAFDGDANHFTWDVTRFRYARNHSQCASDCNQSSTDTHVMGLAFGFNEGWAEFWANDAWGCSSSNMECEGNVAHALLNISRMPGMDKKKMVEILKAHPGEIHSLDEFVQFLPGNGMSSSALIQLENSGKDRELIAKAKVFPVMSSQVLQREVQKQISEGNRQINLKKEKLASAVKRAARIKNCDSLGCYQTVQLLIQPIVLDAEMKLNQMALRRISDNASANIRERYKTMITDGSWEVRTKNIRQSAQEQIIQINLNAYKQAIRVIQNLKGNSDEKKALEEEMMRKYNQFKLLAQQKKIPINANPPLLSAEDVAKKR